MEQLDADATRQGIDDKTLWIEVPYLEDGGVRSRVIVGLRFLCICTTTERFTGRGLP